MFITIYITFVIVNIIICSILTYIDYKNYIEITVSDIIIDFIAIAFSFIGTALFLMGIWDYYSDKVIFQRKRK